jgi:hypothetical protein
VVPYRPAVRAAPVVYMAQGFDLVVGHDMQMAGRPFWQWVAGGTAPIKRLGLRVQPPLPAAAGRAGTVRLVGWGRCFIGKSGPRGQVTTDYKPQRSDRRHPRQTAHCALYTLSLLY